MNNREKVSRYFSELQFYFDAFRDFTRFHPTSLRNRFYFCTNDTIMHYEIRDDYPNQQFLQIRAEFNVTGNALELQFPTWRPGRYELGNFAKNVRSFKVFDAHGKLLQSSKSDTHVWKIENIETPKIVVQYSYFAAELNAGSTFLSKDMLYVNPVNCLVYCKGREEEKCSLQVHPLPGMHYAGTLPENAGFMEAQSYHDLVDSPFVYCHDLCSEVYTYKGVEFRVSFIGLQEVPWERVLSDFQKFTRKQFDDFGHFPSKTFHFINIITPYPHYHGVEHRASTVIVLGPNYKIFESYYDELLGVSSHELYHVWNVKSIRSVDLWPYDYSGENLSTMGYLCEGITTYLGDYYLMLSGVWSPEKYLRELELVIQKHLDNFGRFNASLAESSFDTWLDGYVAGAPSRKVSIYNEGALFAFITDLFIRSQTQGKKTLLDVMHALYHRFFLKNKGVSDEDFILLVEEFATEQPYREVFQDLIYKRGSYEARIVEALEGLGFDLDFQDNLEPISARLGIKTTFEQGFAKVNTILTGSDGDLAGLMLGDKIMAINNFVISNDFDQWVKHFNDEILHLLVNRQGRVVNIEVPCSNINYFKKPVLVPLQIPSGLSLRVFSYWSGARKLRK